MTSAPPPATRPSATLRWPKLLGVAAVVVAAAVVAAVIVARARSEQQPPALKASVNVYRLAAPPGNLPSLDYTSVATLHGRRYLLYGGTSDGGRVAQIWVSDYEHSSQPTLVSVPAGETKIAVGVQVRVLHIWSMPNPSHDAIDVWVVPAP